MKHTLISTLGAIIISIIILSLGLWVILNFKKYSDFQVNLNQWFWYERKANKWAIYSGRFITLAVGICFFIFGLEMLLGITLRFDLIGWLTDW
jgi:hypothetical protein